MSVELGSLLLPRGLSRRIGSGVLTPGELTEPLHSVLGAHVWAGPHGKLGDSQTKLSLLQQQYSTLGACPAFANCGSNAKNIVNIDKFITKFFILNGISRLLYVFAGSRPHITKSK